MMSFYAYKWRAPSKLKSKHHIYICEKEQKIGHSFAINGKHIHGCKCQPFLTDGQRGR